MTTCPNLDHAILDLHGFPPTAAQNYDIWWDEHTKETIISDGQRAVLLDETRSWWTTPVTGSWCGSLDGTLNGVGNPKESFAASGETIALINWFSDESKRERSAKSGLPVRGWKDCGQGSCYVEHSKDCCFGFSTERRNGRHFRLKKVAFQQGTDAREQQFHPLHAEPQIAPTKHEVPPLATDFVLIEACESTLPLSLDAGTESCVGIFQESY